MISLGFSKIKNDASFNGSAISNNQQELLWKYHAINNVYYSIAAF